MAGTAFDDGSRSLARPVSTSFAIGDPKMTSTLPGSSMESVPRGWWEFRMAHAPADSLGKCGGVSRASEYAPEDEELCHPENGEEEKVGS